MTSTDSNGLSSQEAERLLSQFGRNEIVERENPFLLKIAAELWQPVPWMLEAAIILQIAIGERLEAAVIAALLLFNVALGYFQEGKARAALSILKSRLSVRATVKRDGVLERNARARTRARRHRKARAWVPRPGRRPHHRGIHSP